MLIVLNVSDKHNVSCYVTLWRLSFKIINEFKWVIKIASS